MRRSEFEKITEASSFDEAMALLYEERDTITTCEVLRRFVNQNITEDNNMLALHIWKAIFNSKDPEWYYYDYCAGSTCTPQQLNNIDDVEQYIGFDKED